jgi:protein O-mannosyl-transferase
VLILLLAILGVYLPVNHFPFLNYDDNDYVTKNDQVKAGINAETIAWAFTTYYAANWHPVTWLSHALDCQVFGLNPAGPHDVNLALHLLTVALLFGVLARVTGNPGRSLMVAALFALHPINVESVAWIAERKNVLSMMFFLLALGAYDWYVRKPRVQRYALSVLLYALGLMAKPQVITFPFVLLLWDYWPLRRVILPNSEREVETPPIEASLQQRPLRWLVIEKVPLFALSVASAVLTMWAQRKGAGVDDTAQVVEGLKNAIVSYVRYLGMALWPARLSPLYPFPASIPAWQVAGAALLLGAITGLVLWFRRYRYLPVGWFWFLGTLVPMIGIVKVGREALADRYAYLSFIGLFIIFCWGLADCARRLRFSVRWQAAGAVAILLPLAVVARRQVSIWDGDLRLWSRALQVTDDNYVAENSLGFAIQDAGQIQQAIPHFLRAIEIEPDYIYPYINLGLYCQRRGDFNGALERYQQAISLTQTGHYDKWRFFVLTHMASTYASLGDVTQARGCLQQALKLRPDSSQEWMSLGVLAQRSGDTEQAVRAFSRAVRLQPSQRGFLLLAEALRQAGKAQEADAVAKEAATLGSGK